MNHGSRAAYANKGCRCEICREANRLWAREHLLAVYLPAQEKERFDRYVDAKELSPSHAVRRALAVLYEQEGVA